MSDNKEGPVCSFCGAKKGQYSEIYKSNIGDQYICKECTEELARYSGVIEDALKRYQYLEAHNKNAGSEAPAKEAEAEEAEKQDPILYGELLFCLFCFGFFSGGFGTCVLIVSFEILVALQSIFNHTGVTSKLFSTFFTNVLISDV